MSEPLVQLYKGLLGEIVRHRCFRPEGIDTAALRPAAAFLLGHCLGECRGLWPRLGPAEQLDLCVSTDGETPHDAMLSLFIQAFARGQVRCPNR